MHVPAFLLYTCGEVCTLLLFFGVKASKLYVVAESTTRYVVCWLLICVCEHTTQETLQYGGHGRKIGRFIFEWQAAGVNGERDGERITGACWRSLQAPAPTYVFTNMHSCI